LFAESPFHAHHLLMADSYVGDVGERDVGRDLLLQREARRRRVLDDRKRRIDANPGHRAPSSAKRAISQAMSREQVEVALAAVEFREKVILHLSIFAGMRPGEFLAIQRKDVSPDATVIEIQRRVYRGKFASPKN
jgi:integrase